MLEAFNSPSPERITAVELTAFAKLCQEIFGDDPFKLSTKYDPNTLSDRLIATEVED